ncbi:MAG: zf-HC2 domain-containing protein [Chloroflexota bacterium]
MNHEEQLILYTADQLDETARAEFEKHLADCAECQADLLLWESIADEINASDSAKPAPVQLAERALEQIHRPSRARLALLRAAQLLRAQVYLVQREMWPASAAVMALGVCVALLSKHVEVVYFIAPMIAASTLSILSGSEHDPAYELTIATATSPWKVLLARLSIVSAYNLLLALGATLLLLFMFPPGMLGTVALGMLAPMAFLSALALLLSLWMGTSNAVVITYVLWVAQIIPYKSIGAWMVSPGWSPVILSYREFWQSPMLLLVLSVLLFALALLSANRPVFKLTQ